MSLIIKYSLKVWPKRLSWARHLKVAFYFNFCVNPGCFFSPFLYILLPESNQKKVDFDFFIYYGYY
ncbi:MAG: hypothetical protein D6778_07360 [Nitrospirae bacterium]|nr:MAG: hypothetical protein D6778_07360 [Nitrospirota bacterium]